MEDARNIDFHFQFLLDENQMDENHTDLGGHQSSLPTVYKIYLKKRNLAAVLSQKLSFYFRHVRLAH